MKNLRVVGHASGALSGIEGVKRSCLGIDSASRTLYVVAPRGESIVLLGYDLVRQREVVEVKLHEIGGSPIKTVAVDYCPEDEAVMCCWAGDGVNYLDRVKLGSGTPIVERVPFQMVHSNGSVVQVSWSPDQELVAVVCLDAAVYVLTSELEVIAEAHLSAPLIELTSVVLEWEGRGQSFACLADGQLEIFDRHGLHTGCSTTSQGVLPIGNCFGWRADGQLIAASLRDNGTMISFLEPNGLRHDSYNITDASSSGIIEQLEWNSDGSLLLVRHSCSGIFVLARSNYKWECKWHYPSSRSVAIWDPERESRLAVVDTDISEIRWIEFAWVRSIHSEHFVVIDGRRVRLTHLSRGILPPPIAHFTLVFDNPVIDVTIVDNSLVALLSIGVVEWRHLDTPENVLGTLKCQTSCPRMMEGHENASVAVIGCIDKKDVVEILQLSSARTEIIDLPGPVTSTSTSDAGRVAIQLSDGSVYEYANVLVSAGTFPTPCSSFLINKNTLFGLSTAQRILYVNGRAVSQQCLSFAVHDGFLLFTNAGAQNVLYLVDLRFSIDDHLDKAHSDKSVALGSSQRFVERGSEIVGCVSTSLILLMPRGNIEIIHPRPLLLLHVSRLLENGSQKWGEALSCLRRHRMDLNLLCDHDLENFIENALQVIADIKDNSHLDVFVSALQNADSVVETYPSYERYRCRPLKASEITDKVDVVCRALYDALTCSSDSDRWLFIRLSALVKPSPPRVEKALQLVADLTTQEQAHAAMKHLIFLVSVQVLYDTALGMYNTKLARTVAQYSHMDPKEYLPQLSMFDDIVPESLRKYRINCHLRRFDHAIREIDVTKLDHGTAQQVFDEVLKFTQDNVHLYISAFHSFSHKREWEAQLQRQYALKLVEDPAMSCRAASLFLMAGDAEMAARAYRKAGDWKRSLAIVGCHSPHTIIDAAAELAAELEGSREYLAAASILVQYCNRIEDAIQILIGGDEFLEAIRVATSVGRFDLVEVDIETALLETANSWCSMLPESHSRYMKLVDRLRVLRKENGGCPDDHSDQEVDIVDQQSSVSVMSNLSQFTLASQISTMTWTSTPWSKISSTTRNGEAPSRKKRRSKKRIQPGDAEEEPYLEKQLRTVSPSLSQLESILTLSETLALRGHFSLARQVQSEFLKFVELCREEESKPMTSSKRGLHWPGGVLRDATASILPIDKFVMVNSNDISAVHDAA